MNRTHHSVMTGRFHERLRWLKGKRGHLPYKVVGTRSLPQLVGNSIHRVLCAQGVSILVQSRFSFVSRMLVALGECGRADNHLTERSFAPQENSRRTDCAHRDSQALRNLVVRAVSGVLPNSRVATPEHCL